MTTPMSNSHKHGTRFAVRQTSKLNLTDSSMALSNTSDPLPASELSLNDVSSLSVHESSSLYVQKLTTLVNKQKKSQTTKSISPPSRSASEMKNTKSSKPTASSIAILPKKKAKSNSSTSAATTPTSTDLSTFSISPTAGQSLSKKKSSTPISTTNKTANTLPAKSNLVAKPLTTTNAIGLKKTSMSTITKTPGGNSLIQDFQKKLKNRDDIIKDLKMKIEERDKTIANLYESSMTIPTEPLVLDWIDHLYEMTHQEKIRDQIDFEDYAERLSMDVNTLKICVNKTDRVKTAREIVRNFPDYQEIIHLDNSWLFISKEQINVVLEFIRKQFGPSLSKTDQVIRTSLSTMVRLASWKVRGDAHAVRPDGNAVQLSEQGDGQNEEENEEEE